MLLPFAMAGHVDDLDLDEDDAGSWDEAATRASCRRSWPRSATPSWPRGRTRWSPRPRRTTRTRTASRSARFLRPCDGGEVVTVIGLHQDGDPVAVPWPTTAGPWCRRAGVRDPWTLGGCADSALSPRRRPVTCRPDRAAARPGSRSQPGRQPAVPARAGGARASTADRASCGAQPARADRDAAGRPARLGGVPGGRWLFDGKSSPASTCGCCSRSRCWPAGCGSWPALKDSPLRPHSLGLCCTPAGGSTSWCRPTASTAVVAGQESVVLRLRRPRGRAGPAGHLRWPVRSVAARAGGSRPHGGDASSPGWPRPPQCREGLAPSVDDAGAGRDRRRGVPARLGLPRLTGSTPARRTHGGDHWQCSRAARGSAEGDVELAQRLVHAARWSGRRRSAGPPTRGRRSSVADPRR